MGSTERSGLKRAVAVAVWFLCVAELLTMGSAGAAKFQTDFWARMFVEWGYPAWFTSVIGAAEVTGALLIVVPRLSSYAAVFLSAIMVGAISTVLLHPGGQLGPVTPAVHLLVIAVIARARWSRRWRPGGASLSAPS
jgi:uncharacterized membrane protein YphA (DoxX/SURF4 family)